MKSKKGQNQHLEQSSLLKKPAMANNQVAGVVEPVLRPVWLTNSEARQLPSRQLGSCRCLKPMISPYSSGVNRNRGFGSLKRQTRVSFRYRKIRIGKMKRVLPRRLPFKNGVRKNFEKLCIHQKKMHQSRQLNHTTRKELINHFDQGHGAMLVSKHCCSGAEAEASEVSNESEWRAYGFQDNLYSCFQYDIRGLRGANGDAESVGNSLDEMNQIKYNLMEMGYDKTDNDEEYEIHENSSLHYPLTSLFPGHRIDKSLFTPPPLFQSEIHLPNFILKNHKKRVPTPNKGKKREESYNKCNSKSENFTDNSEGKRSKFQSGKIRPRQPVPIYKASDYFKLKESKSTDDSGGTDDSYTETDSSSLSPRSNPLKEALEAHTKRKEIEANTFKGHGLSKTKSLINCSNCKGGDGDGVRDTNFGAAFKNEEAIRRIWDRKILLPTERDYKMYPGCEGHFCCDKISDKHFPNRLNEAQELKTAWVDSKTVDGTKDNAVVATEPHNYSARGQEPNVDDLCNKFNRLNAPMRSVLSCESQRVVPGLRNRQENMYYDSVIEKSKELSNHSNPEPLGKDATSQHKDKMTHYCSEGHPSVRGVVSDNVQLNRDWYNEHPFRRRGYFSEQNHRATFKSPQQSRGIGFFRCQHRTLPIFSRWVPPGFKINHLHPINLNVPNGSNVRMQVGAQGSTNGVQVRPNSMVSNHQTLGFNSGLHNPAIHTSNKINTGGQYFAYVPKTVQQHLGTCKEQFSPCFNARKGPAYYGPNFKDAYNLRQNYGLRKPEQLNNFGPSKYPLFNLTDHTKEKNVDESCCTSEVQARRQSNSSEQYYAIENAVTETSDFKRASSTRQTLLRMCDYSVQTNDTEISSSESCSSVEKSLTSPSPIEDKENNLNLEQSGEPTIVINNSEEIEERQIEDKFTSEISEEYSLVPPPIGNYLLDDEKDIKLCHKSDEVEQDYGDFSKSRSESTTSSSSARKESFCDNGPASPQINDDECHASFLEGFFMGYFGPRKGKMEIPFNKNILRMTCLERALYVNSVDRRSSTPESDMDGHQRDFSNHSNSDVDSYRADSISPDSTLYDSAFSDTSETSAFQSGTEYDSDALWVTDGPMEPAYNFPEI